MKPAGTFTREEILSQTDAWREACDVVTACDHVPDLDDARARRGQVLITGCGSTYYLAQAAAAHLRGLARRPAQAAPASELWLYPQAYLQADDTLIAISRSGATSETLRAVAAFEATTHRSPITIQCAPDAPLARRPGPTIVVRRGAERSVAQTRSFTSMFTATVALNARWARRADLTAALAGLPAAGDRVLSLGAAVARDLGPRLEFDRLYFLGSGTRYGLACEASLKMKEMALSHTEPFHFLEFRHGPKSMLTESTLVVGLVSDEAAGEELQVLDETAALGATVFVLGEKVAPVRGGPALSFGSGLPAEIRDALYLPSLQLLAYERAIAQGLDPDRPRHLDAVVVIEESRAPARSDGSR
jgi:glucosamine--fructose-6-phosphate aminotransferase (isomerizing)